MTLQGIVLKRLRETDGDEEKCSAQGVQLYPVFCRVTAL